MDRLWEACHDISSTDYHPVKLQCIIQSTVKRKRKRKKKIFVSVKKFSFIHNQEILLGPLKCATTSPITAPSNGLHLTLYYTMTLNKTPFKNI